MNIKSKSTVPRYTSSFSFQQVTIALYMKLLGCNFIFYAPYTFNMHNDVNYHICGCLTKLDWSSRVLVAHLWCYNFCFTYRWCCFYNLVHELQPAIYIKGLLATLENNKVKQFIEIYPRFTSNVALHLAYPHSILLFLHKLIRAS